MWLRKLFIQMICVVIFAYYNTYNAFRNTIMIKNQQSLCLRTDIRQGKWTEIAKKSTSDNGLSVMEVPPTQYQWLPRGHYLNPNNNGIGSNSNRVTTSSTCLYQEEFNSTLFCNLMNNSVILFIGDSITWEMYESLVHLTNGKASIKLKNRAIYKRLPIIINVCGNSNSNNNSNNNNNNTNDNDNNVTLIYRWNKQLDGTGTSVSIEQMLKEQFPTMIVLNTGAHYQSDASLRAKLASTLVQIRAWQQTCRYRLNNVTCPFFWRTTTPGIPHCQNFSQPVNDIAKMEHHVALYPTYNWEKIKYQNDTVLGMLELEHTTATTTTMSTSGGGLEYQVIDGYEIGIQRPELHSSETDCLHHSDLAVADAWNVALLHYLRASWTMEDVERVANYKYDFSRVSNVHPSGKDLDWDLVNG